MILNAVEITNAINKLNTVHNGMLEVVKNTNTVVCTKLPVYWEGMAEQAYRDNYLIIRDKILNRINELIGFFHIALEKTNNGLYQVDVDLARMNAKAVM